MDGPRKDPSLDDALYYAGGLLWEWGVLENGLNGAIAALRRGDAEASARPPSDFDKRFAQRLREWRKLQVARHGEASDNVRFADQVIATRWLAALLVMRITPPRGWSASAATSRT